MNVARTRQCRRRASLAPACSPRTPALRLAVWRERLDTVKLLFERGAPLETRNRQGETPLSLASRAQSEGSEFTPHESEEVLNMMRTADA